MAAGRRHRSTSSCAPGEGEFITGFAGPFTLLVIADLLGVPEEDRDRVRSSGSRAAPTAAALGSTEQDADAQTPLEFLYEVFATYVEDRRREPRDDVLTGLATATFPDGSMPEVGDVVRVATNVFSAGQETTVRLLSTALKVIGDHPDIQQQAARGPQPAPELHRGGAAHREPGQGRLPAVASADHRRRGRPSPPARTVMVVNGAANRDPRRFDDPDTFDPERKNARQHLAFGRGIHSCPGAPLARAETRVGIERLLDRTTDIRISEAHARPGRTAAATNTFRPTSCAA